MEKQVPQLIVVIPCYKEPDVMQTVQSLFDCEQGRFVVEIILLVNSYQINSTSTLEINKFSYSQAKTYADVNNTATFYLTPIFVDNLPGHQTGAGLPRKIGMEEALKHFKGDKSGIIVSLDADCRVEKNYLVEIYRNFKKNRLNSATIRFHHPIEHLDESDNLREAMLCYEEYLHYYRLALEYTGYPYPYYTVGSAFAVTAETYIKAGGMGKQQSGEDFYFLQKVFPLGRTKYIETTCVYPAARVSDRVPFGTGPALAKMLEENKILKLSYQLEAFRTLKSFFTRIDYFFKTPEEEIEQYVNKFPDYLVKFLGEDGFLDKIGEINEHTSTLPNFRKRFFNYFNAFKILKYLNFAHPTFLNLVDIKQQFVDLNA